MIHDLVIVGASPAGLSVAVQAGRAGLREVVVLALPEMALLEEAEGVNRLSIRRISAVERIRSPDDGHLRVETTEGVFETRVCVLDLAGSPGGGVVPWDIPESVAGRIHRFADFEAADSDVLVVGDGEVAAVLTWQLVESGARVVLSFTGEYGNLSLVARQVIERLEREQKATVLWRSRPVHLWDTDGFPMVGFEDRRTPDLQFDHVVIAGEDRGQHPEIDIELDDPSWNALYSISETGTEAADGVVLRPAEAWPSIRARHFTEFAALAPRVVTDLSRDQIRELEVEHYNATLTGFDTAHNELWRIRVRPDRAAVAHRAGQYCSLGLGYWEPRADDAVDPGLDEKRHKLVRRSYSISSPVFDEHGYLADSAESDEIELYIVWVQADETRVPGLTPRLALKHAGDRLYLGPKIVGRYTIRPVTNPAAPVLFCATGTGEAPHNAMVVELLRKGHYGPILSVVSVRYRSDLAYLEEHRRLEQRFANYRYLPMPTREPDVPKRYIQDLLSDRTVERELRSPLDPNAVHVFLCGNPSMIGLPVWDEDEPTFPDRCGVAEVLHGLGFVLDRRGIDGNVHYEEYW